MIIHWLLIVVAGTVLVFAIPSGVAYLVTRARIHTPADAPAARVAIVFGAGLTRDGSPSPILRDRVATAVDLYKAGKVNKLLMSGDNRFITYNEPASMREYALGLGVPDEDIVLDYAGRRTYDTCYRAQSIFHVDQAVLVTQAFHLPRAVFTCQGLGLNADGVVADRRPYSRRSLSFWRMREVGATLVAAWEVYVSRPEPVLGDPLPIFSDTEITGQPTAPGN